MANESESGKSGVDNTNKCSCSTQGTKKRIWESSHTSLNSKKVKGGHAVECRSDSRDSFSGGDERKCNSNAISLFSGNKLSTDGASLTIGCLKENNKEWIAVNVISNLGNCDLPSTDICFRVMLMNIADDKKKESLTKIIEDLGGIVTSDGSISTHVVTGKVRRTLNFCTALCSGIAVKDWKLEWESSRGFSMIPFADFLNHDGTSEACLWSDEGKLLSEVIADRNYIPGDQVLIRYAKFSNGTLALDFGFTLPYNIHDQVQIELNVPHDDHLHQMKLELLHRYHAPAIKDINGFSSSENFFTIKFMEVFLT